MNQKNYRQSSLAKTDTSVSGRLNFENNQQFNGYGDPSQVYDQAPLRPNYTRQELNNADIPNQIGKEIRAQKYRIFFVQLLGAIMMIVGAFFIACWWGAPVDKSGSEPTQWLIPTKSVPHPGFMIPMTAIGLVMFILSSIEYSQLCKNVRSYKADILDGRESVPYFLIKSYKSLIARVTYTNWICATLYILEAIVIGILCGMNWWPDSATAPGKNIYYGQMWTELIIMFVIVGLTFIAHIGTLISSKVRRGNLDAYFNSQIVSDETQREIRKHANRVCLVTFVIVMFVVFFLISIPWMIARKKQKKPLIP